MTLDPWIVALLVAPAGVVVIVALLRGYSVTLILTRPESGPRRRRRGRDVDEALDDEERA